MCSEEKDQTESKAWSSFERNQEMIFSIQMNLSKIFKERKRKLKGGKSNVNFQKHFGKTTSMP